jgi:tryptophan halogenase
MTVAALGAHMPADIRVTWLKVPGTDAYDVLYGNVAPPSAYDFNLTIGLDEPALVIDGKVSFAFGTRYVDWGPDRRAWIQAFHAPFPVLNGVIFYHYVLRQGQSALAPFLVSAEAAANGVFAHPPEDQRHPLSRAEYGYQFDPAAYGAAFERLVSPAVTRIESPIARVHRDGDGIASVELVDGRALTADLYIDCTGPAAHLGVPMTGGRALSLLAGRVPSADLGAPVRTVTAGAYGWTAQTQVEGSVLRLTVYDKADRDLAGKAHGQPVTFEADVTLGHRPEAWTGNCVAIGQAAGVVEPVTPAPFMLLQHDIERLLSLLPVSRDMAVERREFNRQYAEDYRNALLFNRALFVSKAAPAGAYWQAAAESPLDERLVAKLEQFESRGLNVAYDLEPFAAEDWIVLHFGMGRQPERHDRMADQMPADALARTLGDMRTGIAQAVRTMPRHGAYRQGLVNFLQQRGA